MLKEFKEFATRGNIMDMAVGVIIGGAFQKIVTSLVNDIIMPLITVFTGEVDFSNLVFTLGNTPIKYGAFITTIVDFLIIAFSIFIAIRSFNKLSASTKENLEKLSDNSKIAKKHRKGKEAEEKVVEPTVKQCPFCLSEIPYHATRCPHCTSSLEEAVTSDK